MQLVVIASDFSWKGRWSKVEALRRRWVERYRVSRKNLMDVFLYGINSIMLYIYVHLNAYHVYMYIYNMYIHIYHCIYILYFKKDSYKCPKNLHRPKYVFRNKKVGSIEGVTIKAAKKQRGWRIESSASPKAQKVSSIESIDNEFTFWDSKIHMFKGFNRLT